jgi:hypothetical protein
LANNQVLIDNKPVQQPAKWISNKLTLASNL